MALMETLSLWLQPGKKEVPQQPSCYRGSHTAHRCSPTPTAPSPARPPGQLSAALSAFCQLLSILTSALLTLAATPWNGDLQQPPPHPQFPGNLQTTHQYYFSKPLTMIVTSV